MSKTTIITDDYGIKRSTACPVIISASRATDIPAFYSDWFFDRIIRGYLKWKNPFNGEYSYVSFSKTRLFVFWSKNPYPIIEKLKLLDEMRYNYYFQYTLNDYERDGFELKLPALEKRIETFQKLSSIIGKEKVIWRYDPIIISKEQEPSNILERIHNLGNKLFPYTDRLVFSFIDIDCYKKVKNNLCKLDAEINEIDQSTMDYISSEIASMNKSWGLSLGTCSETIDLEKYGIEHNRCIDDRLIYQLFSDDDELMNFLGFVQGDFLMQDSGYSYEKIRDKGQRKACGCIQSKDIGQYNTCPHGCVYCYANTSYEVAEKNWKQSLGKTSETIV